MNFRKLLYSTTAAIGIAVMAVAVSAPAGAQQAMVEIDKDDIGGVVTGPSGPEAGVWVIAETTELPSVIHELLDELRAVTTGQPAGLLPAR